MESRCQDNLSQLLSYTAPAHTTTTHPSAVSQVQYIPSFNCIVWLLNLFHCFHVAYCLTYCFVRCRWVCVFVCVRRCFGGANEGVWFKVSCLFVPEGVLLQLLLWSPPWCSDKCCSMLLNQRSGIRYTWNNVLNCVCVMLYKQAPGKTQVMFIRCESIAYTVSPALQMTSPRR